MKRLRGVVAAALAFALVGLLGGCAADGNSSSNGNNETTIQAADMFTGDPDALRVFVRNGSTYPEALTKQFPDIKFDFYHYGGLNTSSAMTRLTNEDCIGDLCLNSLQLDAKTSEAHLMDLSKYAFCDNYEPTILSQFDVDGKLYQLPGPLAMRSIVYNKVMFDEHGWQEPQTLDELVALCEQIRAEAPGVTPIVMGGAASGYYFTTMTTYAQSEYLYTPEGRAWSKAYAEGKAMPSEGLATGIADTDRLIQAGAFDVAANEGMWDAELFATRMATNEAAMMFLWGSPKGVAEEMQKAPEGTYELMPFRNSQGTAFLGTNIFFNMGLSKSLEEPGNEAKLENALRVMEWLASPEGAAALSPEATSSIFPFRGAVNPDVFPAYQELWNENLDCLKAPMLYAGYEDILVPSAEAIMEAAANGTSLDGLGAMMDETHQAYLDKGTEGVSAGSFERDFTHAETVQAFAHILYSAGGSDLALVSDGTRINGANNAGGVWLNFFEGPVLTDELTICLPGTQVNKPLMQLTLSGTQIFTLLEEGKHCVDEDAEGKPEANFDYYWAGATVEMQDGKVTKATLDDGREIEASGEYTVTFAFGDYADDLPEQAKSAVELDQTAQALTRTYLEQNSPVKPFEVTRK